MAPSPFVELPLEIRQQIYSSLIPTINTPATEDTHRCKKTNEWIEYAPPAAGTYSACLALLPTCRKIYLEVLQQWYSAAKFGFKLGSTVTGLEACFVCRRFDVGLDLKYYEVTSFLASRRPRPHLKLEARGYTELLGLPQGFCFITSLDVAIHSRYRSLDHMNGESYDLRKSLLERDLMERLARFFSEDGPRRLKHLKLDISINSVTWLE